MVKPSVVHRQRPRHTKGMYLPAPPPVLVLPGRQHLVQHLPPASRSTAQNHAIQDIFNLNKDSFADTLYMPHGPLTNVSHLSGLQKKQNQWWRWSQDIIPDLIKPYLTYLHESEFLRRPTDIQTGCLETKCTAFYTRCSLIITCVLFDCMLSFYQHTTV